MPRIGELVLWCQHFPDDLDLVFDPTNGEHRFYSFEHARFLRHPAWRGGVITTVPNNAAIDGPIDFPDILSNPNKTTALNRSGFRVEEMPDPNADENKSASKRYSIVPLRNIRPLGHWQSLLRGIPERKLDPSVKYALTAMTTLSLLDKFKFVGEWPNASIHCKGIYLGGELIIVGDAVRILPLSQSQQQTSFSLGSPPERPRCTDVLVISSIRLNLLNIQPEHIATTAPISPLLSTSMSITLVGRAYTIDPKRDHRLLDLDKLESSQSSITTIKVPTPFPREQVKSLFPTVGAREYGDWYPLHADDKRYEISFDRVLGRLYEADAIRLWNGQLQFKDEKETAGPNKPTPSLSWDMASIIAGRKYATLTDERIPEAPRGVIRWFWADTRALALNVESFNGYEVGPYDEVRDRETLKAWRATLKVIDGTASQQDVRDTCLPRRKGRPEGARLVDGRVLLPGESNRRRESFSFGGSQGGGGGVMGGRMKGSSQLVGAALEDTSSEDGSEDDGDGDRGGSGSGLDSGLSRKSSGAAKQQTRKSSGIKSAGMGGSLLRSIEIGDSEKDSGPDEEDEEDNDEEEEEEDDLEDLLTVPLARGGTEESEGGDYTPLLDSFKGSRTSSSGPSKRPRF